MHVVENGHIKRITDGDIQSSVLEVASANVATTFIKCPADPDKTLGIKLPFLVMIIKNLNKYFSFEVQVLDDKNVRRRFRASNYQVSPVTPPTCLTSAVLYNMSGCFEDQTCFLETETWQQQAGHLLHLLHLLPVGSVRLGSCCTCISSRLLQASFSVPLCFGRWLFCQLTLCQRK